MNDIVKNTKSSKKILDESENKPVLINDKRKENHSEIIVTHILHKIINVIVKKQDLEEFISGNLNNHIIKNVDNLISIVNQQNFILSDNDICNVKLKNNANNSKENLIKIENNNDLNIKEKEMNEKTASLSSNFNNTKYSNLFLIHEINNELNNAKNKDIEKEFIKTNSTKVNHNNNNNNNNINSNLNEKMNIVFNQTNYKNDKFGWNNAKIKNKYNNYNYYCNPVSNINLEIIFKG